MNLRIILIVALLLPGLLGMAFAEDNVSFNLSNDSTQEVELSAGKGTITELTPVGAPYTTEGPIQFRVTTANTGSGNIPWGTLTLEIRYGPTNQLVESVVYDVGEIRRGESRTFLWNTTNVDFPYDSFQTGGSYIITATWNYPSGPATRSTQFYSVPSPWFIVALAGILMSVAAIAHKKRWWLTFYLAGAVSFMAFIVSFFIITGLDTWIMGIEAQNIAALATAFGIPSEFLPPNAFIFPDPTGWSIFGIGMECSAIIEIGVLSGLLILYPGYSWKRKSRYAAIGIGITYGANLIRMMSIVYLVNIFGKPALYVAHAFVGKIIFFIFIIVLYWYLLTRPTLSIVRDNIKGGKFE